MTKILYLQKFRANMIKIFTSDIPFCKVTNYGTVNVQMINLGEENVEEVGEKYENETFKDE